MPPRPVQPMNEFVHPEASHARRVKPKFFIIEPINAFYCFLAANLISALYNPIQDCDETFNYWEPTHYLTHGYGLQTWEYSPDYSIRSWLYVSLHAIVASIRRILPQSTKLGEFYFVRYILAFICSLCQAYLYRSISRAISPRIGVFFVLALFLSPGNFHASTAYLPSSFAMYMVMLGAASFIDWVGGLKTSWGVFWFGVAGIVGWPFATALAIPFLLEEALFMAMGDKEALIERVWLVGRGSIGALIVLALDVLVNMFFYRKIEVVPWNIVKYNIFSSGGGPELYGTEPWTFYFKNLALNFNVWFVLALFALPIFIIQKIVSPNVRGFASNMRMIVFVAPFYMWLTIFTLQPHKEERFMFPAYPFLALNAAISCHIILSALGHVDRNTFIGKIPTGLKLVVAVVIPLVAVTYLYVLRVGGIYNAYGAPLSIYEPLGAGVRGGEVGTVGRPGDFVCFGKEWYRFPNSFFLPQGMKSKFIQSEFRGLLPGEFSEAGHGFGLFPGTWMPTQGMNDLNQEDMSKYVEIGACKFLVDTQYPLNAEKGLAPPPREPEYITDTENWKVVKCLPFMDAANTGLIPRMFWVPNWWTWVPEQYKRKWGQHCLLQKKQSK